MDSTIQQRPQNKDVFLHYTGVEHQNALDALYEKNKKALKNSSVLIKRGLYNPYEDLEKKEDCPPVRVSWHAHMNAGKNNEALPAVHSQEENILRMWQAGLRGCFYFTTGVFIKDIRVSEDGVIDIKSFNADTITLTTNHGILLSTAQGSEATFNVWEIINSSTQTTDLTYVRVTLSFEKCKDKEFAWTQPFWLTLDGNCFAVDRRREHNEIQQKSMRTDGSITKFSKKACGRFLQTTGYISRLYA